MQPDRESARSASKGSSKVDMPAFPHAMPGMTKANPAMASGFTARPQKAARR
jgi:hypothetical protein